MRSFRSVGFKAVCFALVLLAASCNGNTGAGPFTTSTSQRPQVIFHARHDVILKVEVASTPEQREKGLMNRTSLAPDQGMIFVWGHDVREGFWMKNTLIPLSVAFIAGNGTIVGIQEMAPLSLDDHRPPVPYRCAVEASRGFFSRNGVQVGDKVSLEYVKR